MKKLILLLSLYGIYFGLQAMDGSLDPSFGDGAGYVDSSFGGFLGFSSAIQTDGKIVVIGTDSNGNTITVRYNTDGSLDTTFGTDGFVTDATGISASGLSVQTDGKIIIIGADSANQNFQLIRYNSDGTFDTTFGTDGVVIGPAGSGFTLELQTDGKIVIVGTDNNTGLFKVVRYNTDGTVDVTFQSGPNEFASCLKIQADGKIVVGGYSNAYNLVVVRYNTDGTLDGSFVQGAAPPGIWATMAIQSDGKIILAGNTLAEVDPSLELVRFNTDGSVDTSFGGGVISGPPGVANDLLLQPDGKPIIVGQPIYNGSTYQLLRYTSTGTLDSSFGSGGIVLAPPGIVAFGGALQTDGKIIAVGGDVTVTNLQVARYLNSSSLASTTITFPAEGSIISESPIVFTGTAQNPSNVSLFLNNILIGSAGTDPLGSNTWTISATVPEAGTYTAQAVSIYADGSVNSSSPETTFEVQSDPVLTIDNVFCSGTKNPALLLGTRGCNRVLIQKVGSSLVETDFRLVPTNQSFSNSFTVDDFDSFDSLCDCS